VTIDATKRPNLICCSLNYSIAKKLFQLPSPNHIPKDKYLPSLVITCES